MPLPKLHGKFVVRRSKILQQFLMQGRVFVGLILVVVIVHEGGGLLLGNILFNPLD